MQAEYHRKSRNGEHSFQVSFSAARRCYQLIEDRLCFTGSWSSIDGIFTLPIRAGRWIVLAAFLGASPFAGAAECSGPAFLEAYVQTHPDPGAYAALRLWFNENHQANCAIDAFQSALKVDSASQSTEDGLAKALIAAGDYWAVISRLQSARRDENLTIDLAADGLTEVLVSLDIHVSHLAAAQPLATSTTTATWMCSS
jgi:hypothetical protein